MIVSLVIIVVNIIMEITLCAPVDTTIVNRYIFILYALTLITLTALVITYRSSCLFDFETLRGL